MEKSKQQPSRIVTQKDHRNVEPGVQTLAGHDQPYNGANKNSSSWLASASPERSSLREAQRTDPQAQTKNMFPRARQKQDPCFCARRKGTEDDGTERTGARLDVQRPSEGSNIASRAHSFARSHARTKRNDFPVGLTPQPPIYTHTYKYICIHRHT